MPRLLLRGWIGLALLVAAVTARADQPEYRPDGTPIPSIAAGLPGGGDPFGHRRWLAERGINYNLWYRTDVLSNLAGGERQGTVSQGLLEPALALDLERLAGLPGLTFFANLFLIHNTGRIRRDYVGGVNTVAAIEAVPTLRLSELWLEQALLGGLVRLRAGQLAADVEFFFARGSELFLQSDFPTIGALNLPSGGPAFPLATPGVMLALEPDPDATLKLAVLNGDPAGPGPGDEQVRNRYGTNFRVRGPPLIFAEAQFRANQRPDDTGLARTLKLGGWAHFGEFNHLRFAADGGLLADPRGPGIPLRLRGNWGVYAVLDQRVWRPRGGDAGSGVSVFGRVSAAPSDRSPIEFYLDGGVVLAGLVPGRPRDRFGFSLIYARFSEALRDFERDRLRLTGSGGPVRGFELNLELTYRAEVRPGLEVQPVLTHVWNPGGEAGRNALVAGFRTLLRF